MSAVKQRRKYCKHSCSDHYTNKNQSVLEAIHLTSSVKRRKTPVQKTVGFVFLYYSGCTAVSTNAVKPKPKLSLRRITKETSNKTQGINQSELEANTVDV